MDQKKINEVLLRNVAKLSKLDAKEEAMMPAGAAPLPSVEEVRRIVSLAKSIIFTDYFYKRQPEEQIRQHYIGVNMEELYALLRRQIARGLQFCEECSEEDVLPTAEELALQFIDQLPEVKRLLYTDVEAMFQNDPAAPNYGEVIYCYPIVNTMTHYRLAHVLHLMQVPVIPRIITEQAHSRTGIPLNSTSSVTPSISSSAALTNSSLVGSMISSARSIYLIWSSFSNAYNWFIIIVFLDYERKVVR